MLASFGTESLTARTHRALAASHARLATRDAATIRTQIAVSQIAARIYGESRQPSGDVTLFWSQFTSLILKVLGRADLLFRATLLQAPMIIALGIGGALTAGKYAPSLDGVRQRLAELKEQAAPLPLTVVLLGGFCGGADDSSPTDSPVYR